MVDRVTSKTEANLLVALAGEADANRRYIAYGFQAINEGRPEIAQLFFEAAGAETVHALTHLKTMGAVGSTRENLERAAMGEMEEIEVILPRMIREAEEDGRPDAAASFRLALERERHHRDMFRTALVQYAATLSGAPPATPAARAAAPSPVAASVAPAPDGAGTARSHGSIGSEILRSAGRGHAAELEREPARIERLSSIREIVFGAQDGLVSTFAVVAGVAAAGVANVVVILAGAVSAVAGILSMSIGTFLSSRAQRQLYEAELAREQREIKEHPGEEIAELIAALMARGMARVDAAEVGRRIARHPELLLSTLAVFELGLAPQQHGTPVRDAFVMAAAFGAGSAVPLVPFVIPDVNTALGVAGALTVVALFAVGAVKGRLGHVSAIRSGLEVVVLGIGSGLIGFALGRLASVLLGVDLG